MKANPIIATLALLALAGSLVAQPKTAIAPEFEDSPYGIPYRKPVTDNEAAAYLTTADLSILDVVSKQIDNTEKGTAILAHFCYLTDIRIANALAAAANRGVNVMVILAANPLNLTNYIAPKFLAQNSVSVFLDYSNSAPLGTENWVTINQDNTVMILSIPPDPKKERTLPASLLLLRQAVATKNALLADFTKHTSDPKIKPFTAPQTSKTTDEELK